MKINVLKSYDELSSTAADIVEKQLKKQPLSKLVLPTGSTPLGMYKELIKRELDWSHTITFNLDEYLMNPDHPYSYHSYMRKNFFDKTNIYPDNYHFPFRPTLVFEDKINYFGAIDLCILGIGGNGHIAFNEPGSSFKSRTRVVDLTEQTIKDNSKYFDSIDDVPKQAITMGLGTIMESKKIVLMANGDHKLTILNVAMNGKVTETVPASILQNHSNILLRYCDSVILMRERFLLLYHS
jgi:glucosamine-6-phosphate deaminase